MSTNFITPNELKQQQEKIARRKRMAELIRASAATPIESPGVAGAKTSPWQVLIKALQGGIGGYEENRANKEETALLARQDASEQNANEQFAVEQNPYGRQRQLPERPPDYITPTETFAVPDSLTPHQAPEMLPGTDQAQYLASIAPTVKPQIPEQVPGREMPPPPPPMQYGPPSEQQAAEFQAQYLASIAPQIPEQVPGREMPPDMASNAPTDGIPLPVFSSMNPTGANQAPVPEQVPGREMPPTPPTYIQSLVAALGQNKKGNEYVDQRRLALANVLNSKDPNKIKFVLDQMGSREEFEQRRQLASEQAGYGLTADELKSTRDVEAALTQAGVNATAATTLNARTVANNLTATNAKIDADSTQAGVNATAAQKLSEVNAATALELSQVHKRAAAALIKAQIERGVTENNARIAAAKLLADAKLAQKQLLTKNQSGGFLKAPVGAQAAAINNQGLMDDIEEAIAFLNDPALDDSMSLANLAKKSISNRLIPENVVKIYSKLGLIASKQVLDMTGKQSSEAETNRYRSFTPNTTGGVLGSSADTKGSAITKLKQYYEDLNRNNTLIEGAYNFKTASSRPPEVPTATWWNYSQKAKDDYVPAPPGLDAEQLKQWATFDNPKRRAIINAGQNDAKSTK